MSKRKLPLITTEDLTLAYGDNIVLDHLNLKIYHKDFICIVGANGSGKTTLVKALLGLLKPATGTIIYHHLRQNHIGYLPQENKISPIFPATVQEVVLSGNLGRMRHRPFYRPPEKHLATKYLKKLDLFHLKNHSFASLSGGQKQKVLLARALVATSELLILDEPSNNLDHASRQDFYHTLRTLNQSGLTILMITHDLDQNDLIGDKVLAIENTTATLTSTADFLKGFAS